MEEGVLFPALILLLQCYFFFDFAFFFLSLGTFADFCQTFFHYILIVLFPIWDIRSFFFLVWR